MHRIEIIYRDGDCTETFLTNSESHAIMMLSNKALERYRDGHEVDIECPPPPICSAEGCERPANCSGKCGAHCECLA